MFKKLFSGKKDAYFLELDESKSQQPAKDKTEAPAKPVEEKKAAPVEAKKTKKTSVKDNGQNAKAAPAPVPKASAPAASDPEAIIKAAVSKSNGKVDPQTVQFAEKYLMMPTMSRRKPGPSLDMFKNMARQVKVPKKG